ncbi:MAG: HAD-IIIA family hydrolase [Candidatus Marinimicrobia bacterium]|jgi:YrbI family 3-deoxy-D-manno-octulosonate 8-phosphate phosphatase|nr:HAD-IIIA family hydrolase [Candidatus Neomarinimicrobiota bacterium]|tara:strand:- start:3330 stop:3809 length:480 start_codon:yes stop_codon:yes gene_type:complete
MSASAKNIKLVGTDIDGVWTDARMYYSADGDIMKSFSTYDGMGVQLLREAGIPLIIMTGEDTEIVAKRAQKLGIDRIFQGENEKLKRLKEVCTELGITLDEVAYIGDDLNDVDVLQAVGISAMPPNSPILDQFTPDYLTTRSGGDGAFRDFVDFILSQK